MLLRHFVLTQLLLSGEAVTQTPVVFNFAFISLCAYLRW